MVVFAVVITSLVTRSTETQQWVALRAEAEGIASGLKGPLTGFPFNIVELEDTVEMFTTATDHRGRITYFSTGSNELDPIPELGESTVIWASREFRVVGVEYELGVVYVAQAVDVGDEQAEGLRAVTWIATVITIIAAMIVSWFVSGRALRPLRQLADTSDAIGTDGDLGQRLPQSKANDEVGRLTLSFNSMLDRIQQALQTSDGNLEQQRRFVADASHDLRTPLTTIRANAGFLLDRTDASSDDRDDAVADISAEADRMAAMLDDLMMLASADSAVPLVFEEIDLAALIDNAAVRSSRVGDQPVTVHGAAPLIVRGSRASLERVMWILIDNAITHGSGPVVIGLTSDQDGVRVSVRDQGAGVEVGNEARLFDRFFREEGSRTSEGSGIGLSIVKAVVEQHGGSVTARNMDPGFELAFQLPVSSAPHL